MLGEGWTVRGHCPRACGIVTGAGSRDQVPRLRHWATWSSWDNFAILEHGRQASIRAGTQNGFGLDILFPHLSAVLDPKSCPIGGVAANGAGATSEWPFIFVCVNEAAEPSGLQGPIQLLPPLHVHPLVLEIVPDGPPGHLLSYFCV